MLYMYWYVNRFNDTNDFKKTNKQKLSKIKMGQRGLAKTKNDAKSVMFSKISESFEKVETNRFKNKNTKRC